MKPKLVGLDPFPKTVMLPILQISLALLISTLDPFPVAKTCDGKISEPISKSVTSLSFSLDSSIISTFPAVKVVNKLFSSACKKNAAVKTVWF